MRAGARPELAKTEYQSQQWKAWARRALNLLQAQAPRLLAAFGSPPSEGGNSKRCAHQEDCAGAQKQLGRGGSKAKVAHLTSTRVTACTRRHYQGGKGFGK
jgi:hypothetical protein